MSQLFRFSTCKNVFNAKFFDVKVKYDNDVIICL
jgi:hypothetical protein